MLSDTIAIQFTQAFLEVIDSMTKLHALIIEDNDFNIQILEQLLDIRHIAHSVVRDPAQLDAVLASIEQIDVIFLDLELPRMTGFEVFEMLQNRYQITVPIVAYTVHTDKMHSARRLGFHSFLGKPLEAERFLEHIERILNDEPVWEASYR